MPPERLSTATDGRVNRRTVLGLLGTVGIGGVSAVASASDDGSRSDANSAGQPRSQAGYSVTQGERCLPVEPLSGSEPVTELYDLRIPDRYVGDNGATDPGTGPYYESAGTRDLQRTDVTITFLYDGPDGLSLVVVHDKGDSEAGGSVSFTLRNVPDGADWVVKDDLYVDPETGEEENFDQWEVDGTSHTIDWTWGGSHNDGGALSLGGDDFEVTVEPAFNEAAALWGEHYAEDPISDWQFLSFPEGRENPERTSLDLDRAVTVSAEPCEGGLLSELTALLDVKPGSDDNRINVKSRGVIPVSVLGDGFDPGDLVTDSIRFGSPRAVDDGDGAVPKDGGTDSDDGLLFHFPTPDAGFEDGDDRAKLVGKIDSDRDVTGTEAVTAVSPGKGRNGETKDEGKGKKKGKNKRKNGKKKDKGKKKGKKNKKKGGNGKKKGKKGKNRKKKGKGKKKGKDH